MIPDALRTFNKIVVTGPQRSGTTICAHILANELKLPYIDENSFKVQDNEQFFYILSMYSRCVIQAPGMAHICDKIHQSIETPVAIVFMLRPIKDIIKSEARIIPPLGPNPYSSITSSKTIKSLISISGA